MKCVGDKPNEFLEVLVKIFNADHKDTIDVHGRRKISLQGALEAAHIENIARQGVPACIALQGLLGRGRRSPAMAASMNKEHLLCESQRSVRRLTLTSAPRTGP